MVAPAAGKHFVFNDDNFDDSNGDRIDKSMIKTCA